MAIQITALKWVPEFAQGYVKDLRIRWALNEAQLPYEVLLVDPQIQASPRFRAAQPFGQVPTYRDADVELFESGAILLHIASLSPRLSPADPQARARITSWVFAALNTIEPHAQNLIHLANPTATDADARLLHEQLASRLAVRLEGLSRWLGDKSFLEGEFTAADLMMTSVLRELIEGGTLEPYGNLLPYVERCLERPAFQQALEAQLQTFRDNAPS